MGTYRTAYNEVVSTGMNRHGCNDAGASNEPFCQRLPSQVIDSDRVLRGNKEERLGRVEQDAGNSSTISPKGVLGGPLAQLVY